MGDGEHETVVMSASDPAFEDRSGTVCQRWLGDTVEVIWRRHTAAESSGRRLSRNTMSTAKGWRSGSSYSAGAQTHIPSGRGRRP